MDGVFGLRIGLVDGEVFIDVKLIKLSEEGTLSSAVAKELMKDWYPIRETIWKSMDRGHS